MDSGRSPGWIFLGHFLDMFSDNRNGQ